MGIFAIGMVAVLALYTPVATAVGGIADADASAKVSEVLHARLQDLGVDTVAKLLKNSTAKGHELTDADASPNYDIRTDTQLLFASRDGTKIGLYNDPIWTIATGANLTPHASDLEKYFEIALIRNETLSPNDPTLDASALVLAYTARIRWPAFVPDSTPGNARDALPLGFNSGGNVRFDYGQKGVLFYAGSVKR